MNTTILAATLAILTTTAYAADESTYISADYMLGDYSSNYGSASPTAARVTVGYNFSDRYALEASVGQGLSGKSVTVGSWRYTFDIDTFAGLYLRGNLPLAERIKAYGLIGITRGQATATGTTTLSSVKVQDTQSDLSYGAGLAVKLYRQWSAHIEYASLISKTSYELNATSIGISYTF